MELFQSGKIENKYKISFENDDYLEYFRKAKLFVEENYIETLNRIVNTKFEQVSPEFFYREIIWTICASGFNAKIVSSFFPKLIATLDPIIWNHNCNIDKIRNDALEVFGNKKKIDAMIAIGNLVREKRKNWNQYRDTDLNSPEKLEKLPFIGKITKNHLGKSLGMQLVKEDLHLSRARQKWGFESALALCQQIAKECNVTIVAADLILFYSLSTFGSK